MWGSSLPWNPADKGKSSFQGPCLDHWVRFFALYILNFRYQTLPQKERICGVFYFQERYLMKLLTNFTLKKTLR